MYDLTPQSGGEADARAKHRVEILSIDFRLSCALTRAAEAGRAEARRELRPGGGRRPLLLLVLHVNQRAQQGTAPGGPAASSTCCLRAAIHAQPHCLPCAVTGPSEAERARDRLAL